MEHRPIPSEPRSYSVDHAAPSETSALEVDAIAAHWRLILALAVAFATVAAGYVLLRQPVFESKAQLVIETGGLSLFRDEPVVVPAPVLPNLLETQVRLIASRGVALDVIDALDLTDDPEFAQRSRPLARLARLLLHGTGAEEPDAAVRNRIATAFMKHVHVGSLGLSNVVELGFSSRDPDKAASIANEIARVYQRRLDQAASERALGASAWVQERLQTVGTHARVISEATAAARGAGMRGALIVAAALLAGVLCGAAGAILLELLAPCARSPEQLAEVLGAEHLGSLPPARPPAERIALDAPASSYARALRNVAAALHEIRRDRPMLLGVASIACGEGTTSVATNLAHLLALQGHQVMLVDCNAEHPTISRDNDLADAPGLGEVLRGAAHEDITVMTDARSGLDILPIGMSGPSLPAGSVFQLPSIGDFATRLRASYEFVLVDLPPILRSTDVRAAAACLDGVLLVVGAGPKPHRLLREALALAGRSRGRLVGFVVNRRAQRSGIAEIALARLCRARPAAI